MVRRRPDQHRPQRPRSSPEDVAPQQARPHLGRRAGRPAHLLVSRAAPRGVPVRQRLKSMGARKGDRITIYMGRIPEIVIAMLACAKIGAIHSVIYGGFSVEALHGRIEDSQSKLLLTADGGWLNGKIVRLKSIVDEAPQRCGCVEHVVVVKRTGHEVVMEQGRDYWYLSLIHISEPTRL